MVPEGALVNIGARLTIAGVPIVAMADERPSGVTARTMRDVTGVSSRAFVDVIAGFSRASVAGVAHTGERSIGAGRVRIAVVRLGKALIDVRASLTVAGVTRVACAAECPRHVVARRVSITGVTAISALVHILAGHAISRVASVASACERACRV